MKKTVALLLGLMLILGFVLVACGDEATEDDTTATTAEATDTSTGDDAVAGVLDWTEAVDYEGKVVTVTGEVVALSNLYDEMGIAKYIVRLGGTEDQDHFNVVFVLNADGTWPAYMAEYEALAPQLVGKTVEATGMISLNSFESCYQILMNDADDNTAPDDEITAGYGMVVK